MNAPADWHQFIEVQFEVVAALREQDCDLLEWGVPGALADTADRRVDGCRARCHPGGVRRRDPQVGVGVDRDVSGAD